jgi:tetratricopeptide (TPR) repeat protein
MRLLKATFILLITTIVTMQATFAISLDDRRKKIVSIIDEELSEVSRLSKQTGNRNPDHLLRMAELYLEKARLWREKENQDFIALPNKVRQRTNKKKYFKTSARYFREANNLCLKITKRFKRYKSIGDVYYILGFNAKEAGKNKTAMKYFARASKKSKGNNITKVKSQISLAELYYNKKQYRKAIPLYEKSLNKFKDKWWTKDSFNLAWCYFRSNKYGRSISKMKEVFKKSSNNKYIDMRPSVERDIGLIFATAGRIEEGIAFYKRIGINFTDQLLRIAVTMKSKGQYTLANKTLRYAFKYEKNPKRFAEIYIEQLDLFASFAKRDSHLATSKKLFSLFKQKKLTSNQVKTLRFQTAKQGAILQKQAAGKTYKRLKKKRTKKANMAISYFGMLKELELNKNFEYAYLQAETTFVIRDFSRAARYYDEAFNMAVTKKNKVFKGRAMEGLLATLGQRRLSKKTKESYYIPVYEKYLANYPTGKRSLSIYQKLFKVYLERKQYDKSKSVLDRFVKVRSKDWKTQEAMIAELMEINRKKKQNDKIRTWIKDIDAKKYIVSKKYAKKLRELLTSMQIEDVQMDLKKGNKKKALVGYHNILKDPNSTKRSKMNAKYNLAALYYEMGAVDNSFKWSNEALDEMSSKDTIQFADSFITISTYMFTRLEFKKSASLAIKIVTKLCKRKSRKKSIAFKNGAFMLLAEGDLVGTEKMISLGERCNVPVSYIDSIRFELLKDYKTGKMWTKYELHINKLSRRKSNWPKLILPINTLSKVHRNFGNLKKSKSLNSKKNKYYARSKKSKKDIPLEALTLISDREITKLEKIQSRIISTKLRYPAKSFQQIMQKKLKWLDQLVAKASSIQKIGSGDGIVKTFKILIETHNAFANEVKSFVPPGMKPKNVPLFQKDMKKQIYGPLLTQARNYEKDAWMSIEQNEILSLNNTAISAKLDNVPIRYWYPEKAIMMDRGGKR